MSWNIVYTAGARRDLRDIYEYIADELLVPETAAGQTRRIMKEIRSLVEMPMESETSGYKCMDREAEQMISRITKKE